MSFFKQLNMLEATGIVFVFILCILLGGFIIGGCLDGWETKWKFNKHKVQAVKFGYAYWQIDDMGNSTFKWIHEKEDKEKKEDKENATNRNIINPLK